MSGIPTSTTDSYGGSNTGRYVLEVGTDGTSIDGTNTIESSELNQMICQLHILDIVNGSW